MPRLLITCLIVTVSCARGAGERPTHWAFRPLARPAGTAERFFHFPARPEADRSTLARRVYFDLLGLPPTPAELAAFVHDPRPDAYERLVDRLLASPQFGER